MSNPFFNAGIGILQGQTPSRTRPNFAANAMGGLQNAMANRTSIQNQSALETERERQKIEYEQKQKQILAEQKFLAFINAGRQPTATSLPPSGLPNIPPTGPPNTPPTEQFGGIPPIPGQGEIQQGTTTPTQQYVSKLNQSLVQINDALGSGEIPSISKYNELLVDKEKVEKEIYEATKLQDSPTSVLEFEYAKKNDLFPGTLQEWIQAKRGGMELVSNGKGGFSLRTNVKPGGSLITGSPEPGSLATDYAYLRDDQGNIVIQNGLPVAAPVPGSRAATDIAEQDLKRQEMDNAEVISSVGEANTMLSAVSGVRDAYENSDTPITGKLSIPASIISTTPQGKVRSYTRTLQSGVALDAIKNLKAVSATGATGFGAMNKEELQLLIDNVGALNPDADDPEIFMQTVYRIEAQYKRVMKDIIDNVSIGRIHELGLGPLVDPYLSRQPPGGVQNTQNAPITQQKTIKFGDNR